MYRHLFQNLLTTRGRLDRIGFFHSSILMMCLFILLSILNRLYLDNSEGALTAYLYTTSLQAFLLLALWTPSIIKRLHDLNASGAFALMPWLAIAADPRRLILLDIHAAAWIERHDTAMTVIYVATVLFYFLLFVLPGIDETNRWGPPGET